MSDEKSTKDLLGLRKYRYKKIDIGGSSINELQSYVNSINGIEKSEVIVLVIYFHYQRFMEVQMEASLLEYELGDGKEVSCIKIAQDNNKYQDNIELLVMWS